VKSPDSKKGYLGFLSALFGIEAEDFIIPPDDVWRGMERRASDSLNATVMSLPENHHVAIMLYFGFSCDPETLTEIGEMFGLSGERVRIIILEALKQLREIGHFDQLGIELANMGNKGKYLEEARARSNAHEALVALKTHYRDASADVTHGQFMLTHMFWCTTDNPCPTCRAQKLLREHGILEAFSTLVDEWYTNAAPDVLDAPIEFTLPGLTAKTKNCLRNDNIGTLRQLVMQTEAEMLRIPNFGRKGLNELKERLEEFSFHFGMKFQRKDK
jgi:hypothetical protein